MDMVVGSVDMEEDSVDMGEGLVDTEAVSYTHLTLTTI